MADGEVLPELQRYENARKATANDLRAALPQKLLLRLAHYEAAIFRAHEAILRDPAFTAKIRHYVVDEKQNAQSALQRVLAEYTVLFNKTKDTYLRERLDDLRDVIIRLSGHLNEALQNQNRAGQGTGRGGAAHREDRIRHSSSRHEAGTADSGSG